MKWIFTGFILLTCLLSSAQDLNDLLLFNQNRIKTSKTAMTVLGAWALGNIGTSGILVWKAEKDQQYFHLMNVGWNTVNLSIATIGFVLERKANPSNFDLPMTIQAHHSSQKIFLFNAGLDVGYILGGAYLWERSKNEHKEKTSYIMEGFGKSFVLQGGFLLIFDFAVYFVKSSQNKALKKLMSGLSISGNGFSFSTKF